MSNKESQRLEKAHQKGTSEPWLRWGPYLSERQWGTVREDYSPGGNAWDYFPSRREHAELGTQRLQCRPVGPFASGRSSWYRAARAVHDSLSFQSLSVGEGERHGVNRLPARDAGCRAFPDPQGVGAPGDRGGLLVHVS